MTAAGPRNAPQQKKAIGKPTADKPATATRQGNQDKFAWFYEMLADPEVSNAGKVCGAGCVMKMAGHKGHFKATHKAVANLCGISQATVRRGLADLIDKRYLEDPDLADVGGANTYHLIFPAQRYEERLKAEIKTRNWLYAEKQWRDEQKEKQFRRAVLVASMKRGAEVEHAKRITENLVARYRKQGVELDPELGLATVANSAQEAFTPATPAAENTPSGDPESDQKRAAPCSPMSSPLLTDEQPPAHIRTPPCSPMSSPLLTPEATTSADDQTHKSFKDFERPVKVFQDLESEPAPREALTRSRSPVLQNGGACELCGPDGIFLDPDGYPVVLIIGDGSGFTEEGFTDEGFTEYPVQCQHSIAGNLAEIQRREKTENLVLCKTGIPEIDSHYPHLRDC